jgi:hypothetical protein
MDDFGAAIADMDEAIELDGKNAAYYKQRGNFHYQLKDKDKACGDWKQAVQLGDVKAKYSVDQYCK